MSFRKDEVLARVERLSVTRLEGWIETECVKPDASEGEPVFSEADLARIRLLCTLQDDFEINEDALLVILSLVDQLHGLRRTLRDLARAVEQQPRAVRDEIARAFRSNIGP
jgi:chaperone modulatory protein CbpM